jgi:hypothetical protein
MTIRSIEVHDLSELFDLHGALQESVEKLLDNIGRNAEPIFVSDTGLRHVSCGASAPDLARINSTFGNR